jgi:5-methylcytosine-specific restriction endonuclease McrA
MAISGKKTGLSLEEILAVQKLARNEVECADLLGVHYTTYKHYASLYGVFGRCKRSKEKDGKNRTLRPYKRNPFRTAQPIDLILQNRYKNIPKNTVKQKLILSGIKKNECEICNYKDVRTSDNKSPIILHFLDKNENNYSIENLQFACFNCSFIYFNMWALDSTKVGGWGKYQKKKKCERLAREKKELEQNNPST